MIPYFFIALVVFILDQASKWLIVNQLELHETKSVIGEFFVLTSHRNKGAAFGILENQQWFFLAITVVIVVAIIWYMKLKVKEQKKLLPFALGMLLGGALGNFVDRALNGEVVDFLQFHFVFKFFGIPVDYIYPIFNIADSAIFVGVACILLESVLDWRKEKKGLAGNEV